MREAKYACSCGREFHWDTQYKKHKEKCGLAVVSHILNANSMPTTDENTNQAAEAEEEDKTDEGSDRNIRT